MSPCTYVGDRLIKLKRRGDIAFDTKTGKYFIIQHLTNNELLPPPSCSALCGNNSKGHLRVTDKTLLDICDICRDKIDPKHERVFVPFK